MQKFYFTLEKLLLSLIKKFISLPTIIFTTAKLVGTDTENSRNFRYILHKVCIEDKLSSVNVCKKSRARICTWNLSIVEYDTWILYKGYNFNASYVKCIKGFKEKNVLFSM